MATKKRVVSEPDGADGVYHAPDGQHYEVYGIAREVEDLDGSVVVIEQAYDDAPRVQSTLGVGERGNLVDSTAD